MNLLNYQLTVIRQGCLPLKQRERSRDDNCKLFIHRRGAEEINLRLNLP